MHGFLFSFALALQYQFDICSLHWGVMNIYFLNVCLQVANLDANEDSFSLKEHLFKDIQQDWPGYSEIDRRTLEVILFQ